jgi:OOP family OmpA-OmpF porin
MRRIFSIIPIAKMMAPLLLVSVFLLPVAARSETRAGSVELTPFAGYNFFESRQNLDNRPVFGGRLGYNITNHFGIEGVGEFINSAVDDRFKPFTREGQFTKRSDSIKVTMYHLDLVYTFMPESKFNPFLVAGYGAAHYSPKINNKNMSIVSYGAGAKYWVADNIALRFDVRDNMVFDETIHNVQLALGVVFAFGGNKKIEPTPVKVVEPTPPPPPAPKVVEPPPAPVDGKVGAWSDWSACSAPCGSGTQTRTRPIVTQPANGGATLPELSENRSCNTQACMEEEKVNLLLQFDFDKAVIKKEFYPNVDAIGAFLKKNNKINITLDGWTDSIGTVKYNMKLSQRRADAVKKYLVDNFKIDPARITAVGHGISKTHDNKTEVGRYKNRRVEMNQTVMVEKK